MSSPPSTERRQYRLGGLDSFVSLSQEPPNPVSTRGQRLPGLIQSRSSSALFMLPRRLGQRERRDSYTSSEVDEERPSIDSRRRSNIYDEIDARRMSLGPEVLAKPEVRSQRLIGNSNPRYRWQQYWKTEDELKKMRKDVRKYYERNNDLIAQYLYIDRLLDSSLPHDLMAEYDRPHPQNQVDVPNTIPEEPITPPDDEFPSKTPPTIPPCSHELTPDHKLKRTPRNLYKIPSNEETPLLADDDDDDGPMPDIDYGADEDVSSGSPLVMSAIYVNLFANILLLIGKIIVILLTSSLSVLASLVDAALDFLSTAIVWITTALISRQDQYAYPVGRRRLEPIGVLVFSVIMCAAFFQVALECLTSLLGPDHDIVQLGVPSIAIMVSTVVIKGGCWFYCRLIKNSSVQALAQDAVTDCIFNTFSIVFPLIGFYARVWWLDALGGLLLSIFVMLNWAHTSSEHVRNLCGAAATADERNILLYLTMRFAKTIKSIQGLQAYHAGDKLNVEVDIVLAEDTSLRDSHDLGESLQYVLESVPTVDRAFVHTDYKSENLPSHMNQQE